MSTPITYSGPRQGSTYETSPRNYPADPVLADADAGDLAALMSSPHWEDRIRARVLADRLTEQITMPAGFPCIVEPEDSPRRAQVLRPQALIWVASPDEDMLTELLPLYQELWDGYHSQWSSPGRVFRLDHRDDVTTSKIYRPGTTAAQVLLATVDLHGHEMFRRAPQHVKDIIDAERARSRS